MKRKKYYMTTFTIILVFIAVPFILAAPPAQTGIGSNTYRLERIIGTKIIIGTKEPAGSTNEKPGTYPGVEKTPGPDVYGTDIGKVNDLVIDAHGHITHIIADLSENRGWIWWTGAGLYVIPSEFFTVHRNGSELAMEIGTVKDPHIPYARSEQMLRQMLKTDVVLIKEFKLFSVTDQDNIPLGSIEDIVVDVVQNEVRYIALYTEDFPGMEDKIYTVPFADLQFDMGNQSITIGITPDWFNSHKPFDPYDWTKNESPWCKSEYIPGVTSVFVNSDCQKKF